MKQVPGYNANKTGHLRRLAKIEGQVRGVSGMVDSDVYCIDVLTQIAATTKALQAVAVGLLDEHLRHCVAEAGPAGTPEAEAKWAEASSAISRLLRS